MISVVRLKNPSVHSSYSFFTLTDQEHILEEAVSVFWQPLSIFHIFLPFLECCDCTSFPYSSFRLILSALSQTPHFVMHWNDFSLFCQLSFLFVLFDHIPLHFAWDYRRFLSTFNISFSNSKKLLNWRFYGFQDVFWVFEHSMYF